MILEAEIINDEPLEAEIITGGNDSPSDVYKGEYTVIPGPNEQILKTKDLVLRKDVTVKAIPDGYVIPEGTLEVAENGVYNVAGYKLAEVKVPDTGGSGGDSGAWYDLTITLTSDCANGGELLEALTPYVPTLRKAKDIAFFTLINANCKPLEKTGVALYGVVSQTTNMTDLTGFMSRYRNVSSISAMVQMTDGYSCSALAGYEYYIKVVNVLE